MLCLDVYVAHAPWPQLLPQSFRFSATVQSRVPADAFGATADAVSISLPATITGPSRYARPEPSQATKYESGMSFSVWPDAQSNPARPAFSSACWVAVSFA